MKAPSCPTAWPEEQQGSQKNINRAATHPVHIWMLHQPSHTAYSDVCRGIAGITCKGQVATATSAAWGLLATEAGVLPCCVCEQVSDLCQGQCPSPGQGSWGCSKCSSCSCYPHFGKTFSLPVTQGADSSQVHPKDE